MSTCDTCLYYEYDEDYSDTKKLTVHLEDVKSAKIIVNFEPVK